MESVGINKGLLALGNDIRAVEASTDGLTLIIALIGLDSFQRVS